MENTKKENTLGLYREDIKQALDVLNRGGIILYPTDTIWGIGCDATNEEAVARIYRLKGREDRKATLALIDSEAKLPYYVEEVPAVAYDLLDAAVNPLTVIYDGARNLARNLLAPDGSIGLRVTHESFSNHLCMRLRRALVSTSANISGAPAPRCFQDISEEILQGVDYVCTSRREEKGCPSPSNIIKLGAGGLVQVIR